MALEHRDGQLATVLLVVHDQDLEIAQLAVAARTQRRRRRFRGTPRVALRICARKLEREGRATTQAVTVGFDAAVVKLRQVTSDRQTEAEAAVRARERAVRLFETLEHLRQEATSRCPLPLSLTRRATCLRLGVDLDGDGAALGRELDCVVQQVGDHLLQSAGIRKNPHWGLGQILLEHLDAWLERRAHAVDRRLDHLCSRQSSADLSRARLDTMLAVSSKSSIKRACATALRSITRIALSRCSSFEPGDEQARPTQDGVQWRAQLVRERGQKLVLQAAGLLGPAIQPCIVDGQRGALAQILGK